MNPSSPSRDGDPDRPESTARPGRAAPGIRLALSLGLSLAALIYVGLKIDFARLWELLRGMNPLYILGVWAFLGLSYLMRAARWQRLLRPVAPARLGTLFSAVLIGFMANNLLPARLGELVRAYAARRLVGVPVSAVLGSLVVERLLDALTFLLLIFVTLLFVDPAASAGGFSTAYLRGAALGLLALYAVVVAVLLALRRRPERVIVFLARLAGRISSPLEERTAAALTAFNQGLGMLGAGPRPARPAGHVPTGHSAPPGLLHRVPAGHGPAPGCLVGGPWPWWARPWPPPSRPGRGTSAPFNSA